MADLPMADRHETVLPEAPESARRALQQALNTGVADRHEAVAQVVADFPTLLGGWASLAELASAPIERYAYARVGYHRGLDALRAAGWGGRGYVRWSNPNNRDALRCLALLRDAAGEIGEHDEVARIDEFLVQLDPDWTNTNL
ncbi:MAG: DUF3151 family protein [Nitriliruptoraceae bacterium]